MGLKQLAASHDLRHEAIGRNLIGCDLLGTFLGRFACLGGQHRAGDPSGQQQYGCDAQPSFKYLNLAQTSGSMPRADERLAH
jgi:hypothetical protein